MGNAPTFSQEHRFLRDRDRWALEDAARSSIPPYSTSDAAALEVLKKIRIVGKRGVHVNLTADPDCDDEPWIVTVYYVGEIPLLDDQETWAETFALGICRAALKAVAT